VFLERCRANTRLPLAVGFGVSTREDMDFIAAHADIAIIGTAALRAWEANRGQGLKDFFAGLGMTA
jgi:tryptophan synthase alpha chain